MILPQELRDVIIDELRDDRMALRASALVCRSWLLRSRSNLFHTITLDRETIVHIEELDEILDANSDLCYYVHELIVATAPVDKVGYEIVVNILEKLDDLESLHFLTGELYGIKSVSWYTDDAELGDQFLATIGGMQHLKTLRFQHGSVRCHTSSDAAWITSSPGLSNL